MLVYFDVTEPGRLLQLVHEMSGPEELIVTRTILHKRRGIGKAIMDRHPLYGRGGDIVICDPRGAPLCGIERKTLEDLARSLTLAGPGDEDRIFRQLRDLRCRPFPILLVEGAPSALYRTIEPAVIGLQAWCAEEGIAIVYSTSLRATARAVVVLARRMKRSLAAPMHRAPKPPDGASR